MQKKSVRATDKFPFRRIALQLPSLYNSIQDGAYTRTSAYNTFHACIVPSAIVAVIVVVAADVLGVMLVVVVVLLMQHILHSRLPCTCAMKMRST